MLVAFGRVSAATGAERVLLPVRGHPGVILEAFVYRPEVVGPSPILIFNHGAAGGEPKRSFRARAEAEAFVKRGFLVIVPMRRGRGGSTGVSPESEAKNCDLTSWLPGISLSFDDLTAAIDFGLKLPETDKSGVILAGTSRGGFLSVAYAAEGERRSDVQAVINFSGGWVAQAEDMCPEDFNLVAFTRYGARTRARTLWLYGVGDPFYEPEAPQAYAKAFEKAGGRVAFKSTTASVGNAHFLSNHPPLWTTDVDAFLAQGSVR